MGLSSNRLDDRIVGAPAKNLFCLGLSQEGIDSGKECKGRVMVDCQDGEVDKGKRQG